MAGTSSTARALRRGVASALAAVVLFGTSVDLGAGSAAAQSAAPPPVPLPSADPFYTPDGPIADLAPGTVIDSRSMTYGSLERATPLASTQVLYRTTDQAGDPSATVATILSPLAPGPAEGDLVPHGL